MKPTSELPEANPLINLKFLGPVSKTKTNSVQCDTLLLCTPHVRTTHDHDKVDDTVVRFKVKRSTQMKKVMKAFSEQQKLFPMESLRFLHNGVRIRGDLTPMDVSKHVIIMYHCLIAYLLDLAAWLMCDSVQLSYSCQACKFHLYCMAHKSLYVYSYI